MDSDAVCTFDLRFSYQDFPDHTVCGVPVGVHIMFDEPAAADNEVEDMRKTPDVTVVAMKKIMLA
jgi:hypothetical protein